MIQISVLWEGEAPAEQFFWGVNDETTVGATRPPTLTLPREGGGDNATAFDP